MKSAKSFLMGTGAVVLAGMVLTLLAPRAARAISATPVQVENTISSPVPSQGILPGVPFSQSCFAPSSTLCNNMVPVVPPGFIFHVTQQNISTSLNQNVTAAPIVQLGYFTAGQFVVVVENLPGAVPGNSFIALDDHDWYIDGGTQAICDTGPSQTNDNTAFLQCTITGYLTH